MGLDKDQIIMLILISLVISFMLGFTLAKRVPYCHVTNKDMEYAWDMIGKGNLSGNYTPARGDFRFIHEDMTLKEVKELYEFYQPTSKFIMVAYLSEVCR